MLAEWNRVEIQHVKHQIRGEAVHNASHGNAIGEELAEFETEGWSESFIGALKSTVTAYCR